MNNRIRALPIAYGKKEVPPENLFPDCTNILDYYLCYIKYLVFMPTHA